MHELLKELADTGLVKVTGSYADGTQHNGSDIDFFVKIPKATVMYGGRNPNFETIRVIVEQYGLKLYGMPFGFSTIPPGGIYNHTGEIHLEFSDVFRPRPGRLKEVQIFGVNFKTH